MPIIEQAVTYNDNNTVTLPTAEYEQLLAERNGFLTDIKTAIQVFADFMGPLGLADEEGIQWGVVAGIVGQAMFGGGPLMEVERYKEKVLPLYEKYKSLYKSVENG